MRKKERERKETGKESCERGEGEKNEEEREMSVEREERGGRARKEGGG